MTCACGAGIPNMVDFHTPADGTEIGMTNLADLNDTESTLAPKDVVLVVTHGLKVLNGATPTMIKCGKIGKLCTLHNGHAGP